MNRGGFLYAGRSLGSNVSKIGFTTSSHPESYVIQRFAGLLEIQNIVAVPHARYAEKLVHFAFRDYRIESFRSRELFVDLPPAHEIQATFCWTAELVDCPAQLRAYAQEHGIRLSPDDSNDSDEGDEGDDEQAAAVLVTGARCSKNWDTMGRAYLAKFYGVPWLCDDFLETFGVYPVEAIRFLLQVADPSYVGEELDRHRYPPSMASLARELLQVLGFAHPLDHGYVTAPLKDLRPALASTAYFSDYSNNVKLFYARASGSGDVLASQKSSTSALNHVFGTLGLRLKSKSMGRNEVKGGEDGKKRQRIYVYGGWYLEQSRQSLALPVVGPPGVDLMAQLLKLQLEGSPGLRGRVSDELREYADGVGHKWPELVRSDEGCIIPRA
jgi:hypothetical protein